MTVRELIEALRKCDPEAIVCQYDDGRELVMDDGEIKLRRVTLVNGLKDECVELHYADAYLDEMRRRYPNAKVELVNGVLLP